MFGNSRTGSLYLSGITREVNYRQEEKKILDSVLGPEVYDKRIRPSGLNSTGENAGNFNKNKKKTRVFYGQRGHCLADGGGGEEGRAEVEVRFGRI